MSSRAVNYADDRIAYGEPSPWRRLSAEYASDARPGPTGTSCSCFRRHSVTVYYISPIAHADDPRT